MKLPRSFYNPISLTGSVIAGATIVVFIFSLLAMKILDIGGSYMGLFIYIILPVFLIIGLILIPIGMVRRGRKLKNTEEVAIKGITLDLGNKQHFNAVLVFVIGTALFLFLSGIGSYEAFHYSESNEFCGTLCHQVMEPEYVAYQESAHSRVTCVECHVGEGADWFVKSKLSGLYQVYSVLTKKFPQPIPTPIESLRPARETCEHCHWPQKFYANRLHNETHYLADAENTEWNIQLKMKIGSENRANGLLEGIHWHINKDVKIEYVSETSEREIILWVRSINKASGDTTVYTDMYSSIDEAGLDTMEIREMDCMDCHNRPSHQFLPPQDFIDEAISAGRIPSELPGIKGLAMELFAVSYPTTDTAKMEMEIAVKEFYASAYPEIVEEKSELIDMAILGFQEGYSKNFFPRMGANWDAYPSQTGHVVFNGCFRCHNGNHVSADESVISRDCNLCHTIMAQGTPDNYMAASINESLEFVHPVDIDEAWKELTCSDCHRYLY
ncbi:cytochrome c3 family protein [Bacteroidota bacterium]